MKIWTFLFLFIFLSGCVTTPKTTVNPNLGKENEQLISDFRAQIKELQTQLLRQQDILDLIAANSYAINIGTKHIVVTDKDGEKGVEIVNNENNLIHKAAGDPSPQRKAEADARLLATTQENLELKTKLYGDALTTIDTKQKEIKARDDLIKQQDQKILQQENAAKLEREENTKKIQSVVTDYENTIQKMKDEERAKERRLWINVLRFGGFGIIVVGIAFLAITSGKSIIPSGILILSGSLVIGIGIAIDIVTSQWWFPYAAGIVALLILAGLVLAAIHIYKKQKFATKAVQVFNDVKTESETLAEKGIADAKQSVADLNTHLAYRFGENWNKILDKNYIEHGLDTK